jgi:hypothetical protein
MKPKVYIAVPIHRYIEPQARDTLDSLMLQAQSWQLGRYEEIRGMSLISKARNIFAERFLASDCTHLFFMDADIICYTKNAIDILIDNDLPIVAAGYIYKSDPLKPAFRIGKTNEDGADLRGKAYPIVAKYVSAGFMLIRRGVFNSLKEYTANPFTPFTNLEDEYLSEDWAFCHNAREFCNINSYIEPRIELGHLGMYPFKLSDYYRLYVDKKGG